MSNEPPQLNDILRIMKLFIDGKIGGEKFERQYCAAHHNLSTKNISSTVISLLDILHTDVSFYQPDPDLLKELKNDLHVDYYDERVLRLRTILSYDKVSARLQRTSQENTIKNDSRDIISTLKYILDSFVSKKISSNCFEADFFDLWDILENNPGRISQDASRLLYEFFIKLCYFTPDEKLRKDLQSTTKMLRYYDEEELRYAAKQLFKKIISLKDNVK